MGGSRAIGKDHQVEHQKFRLEEHYLPFWNPRVLISDNGHQYNNTPFKEFCEQLGIKNHYSSPSHPQANKQAEIAN